LKTKAQAAIFGFNLPKIAEMKAEPRCPACGSKTVEVLSTADPVGYTGIFRCLADDCDCYSVPTMPEIHR
jgi:hypothetical protein